MAPSYSKPSNGSGDKFTKEITKILLPLIPDLSEDELTADNSVQFSLRSTPTDPNSPKYKVTVRVLKGGEQVRTMISWYQDANKVITGLHVTDYAGAVNLVTTMMTATPLSVFKNNLISQRDARFEQRLDNEMDPTHKATIRAEGNEHANNLRFEHIDHALKHVLTTLMPREVLARVKRHLRRNCRKPGHMKIREYIQHLSRVNNDKIPLLPPFGRNQNLNADEILDVILFGTPKSWQREMDRQGFDPIENDIDQVVSFMDNVETAEEFDNDKGTQKNTNKKVDAKKKTSKTNGGGASSSNGNGNNNKGTKYCIVHGQCSHTTNECRTIQHEAKKAKTGGNNNNNGGGKQQVSSENIKKNGNKTWSRKAEEAKKEAQNDMAAFVQKEVAKSYMKMVKAHKKRKSDDSDDDSLAAFDIADFNYEDVENLSVDDDKTEVSV